jgi:porin
MKRYSALGRRGLSACLFLIALCLPLVAVSAGADEWDENPYDDRAYSFLAGGQPTLTQSGELSQPALAEDETDYAAGTAGDECLDECDSSGCSCGSHSSCLCAENMLCDNWAGPLTSFGVTADFELTHFYQGVASGGQRRDWEYGGKLDYFFNFDGEKMGLWDGLTAVMHAETRFGDDVNFDAVSLAPVNANMLYPDPFDDVTSITGFLINQQLNEEWLASAGKFNLFDLFEQLYPQTGRGIDGFMNVSSFAPLVFARTLNLSVMGAGFTKVDKRGVEASITVVDTRSSTTTSGFDELFDNGAVILGFYRFFHELGGLPGSNAIMGDYSSGTYTSLDPTTITILPDSGIVAGQETGSWAISYIFEQKLWVDRCNANRNIGLLSMWGIADDNPSPIDWTGNAAIQAFGFNSSRPGDSMGVAWFHTSLTGNFKQLVSPVFALHDVTGVEAYYNAAITPWFHLTGDLQVVEPADLSNDTALVLGLRANFAL